jgi:uncharacterized protein (DUF3084 family)
MKEFQIKNSQLLLENETKAKVIESLKRELQNTEETLEQTKNALKVKIFHFSPNSLIKISFFILFLILFCNIFNKLINKDIKEEKEKLNGEFIQLNNAHTLLKSEFTSIYQPSIDRLREELQIAKEKYDLMTKQHIEDDEKICKLNEQKRELETQLHTLNEELTKLKEESNEINEMKNRVKILEEEKTNVQMFILLFLFCFKI